MLLAELEDRYGLTTAALGLIAGSAFAAALVTQLGLARYADRGYGLLLLRVGVIMAAVGLLWFAAGTRLWQFVAARAVLGASVGLIVPRLAGRSCWRPMGTSVSAWACSTRRISPALSSGRRSPAY